MDDFCWVCGKTIETQIYKNSGWCSQKCMKALAHQGLPEHISYDDSTEEHWIVIDNARAALGLPPIVKSRD